MSRSRSTKGTAARTDGRPGAARAPYDVGYGKPPKHTQFKPGQSGNPKGRPKGSQNLETILSEAIYRPVQVTEGGRRKRVTAAGVFARLVVKSALEGDHRSGDRLLRLIILLRSLSSGTSGEPAGAAGAEEGTRASDKAVLQAFFAMLKEEGLTEADLDGGDFDDAPVR